MGDPKKKTKKRFKKSATIEKNLKNISVTKFELEFEVDPLFKKTSSQFDGSAGGNQFLATLNVRDETCELLLDSGTTLESIHDERDVPSDVELQEIEMPNIENSLICPTFSGFTFNGWSVDKEEADEAYDKLNESINLNNSQNKGNSLEGGDDNAFDQFAEPEPIDISGTTSVWLTTTTRWRETGTSRASGVRRLRLSHRGQLGLVSPLTCP